MTSKQHILDEIIRTAKTNGGVPLGQNRFESETGINSYVWGKYWARWGDVLRAAGFQPNRFNSAYNDEILNEHLIAFIRELRKFPTKAELIVKRHSDPNFPSHNAFMRIGKRALASNLLAYCRLKGGLEDIEELCNSALEEEGDEGKAASTTDKSKNIGFVYLLKSGRHYKIGKTNAIGRRERELAIQLPEKVANVHAIKTDDPTGIEAYWHKRFEAKRKHGEWFELSAADVNAFKRRKFM